MTKYQLEDMKSQESLVDGRGIREMSYKERLSFSEKNLTGKSCVPINGWLHNGPSVRFGDGAHQESLWTTQIRGIFHAGS